MGNKESMSQQNHDPQVDLISELREIALEIGFHSLGIAAAGRSPHADHYLDWIETGKHGSMEWMTRNVERRIDPRKSLPGAKSVIVVTLPYSSSVDESRDGGKIARYAQGRDYHKVMKPMLEQLSRFVTNDGEWDSWYTVDSSPMLERDWAQLAGVGWIGKNSLVIDLDIGSYFFLGTVVTDRPYPVTSPVEDRCGECTRCIDACPTDALRTPRVIDSKDCITHWNVEHRGPFPEEVRLSDWLLGCDRCQEACPWNHRPARLIPEIHPELAPRNPLTDLEKISSISHDDWLDQYSGTPITRAGHPGLMRNARKILEEREDPSK